MARKRPQPSPTPTPAPTPTPTAISGTAGDDAITWSQPGSGLIDGGAGVDTLSILLGSFTVDVVMSGPIASGTTTTLSTGLAFRNIEQVRITTGSGNDRLFGGAGNDYFATGLGNDQVNGGGGDDWFSLGQGNNSATGGTGADTYFLLHDGQVTISDFSRAEGDRLFLDINGMDVTTSWGLANGFIRFSDGPGGAVVEVDFDGSGTAFAWSPVAVLQGITAAMITPDYFVA